MSENRMPAEAFNVWDYIAEELGEREWSYQELIERMGGDDVTALAMDMVRYSRDHEIPLGDDLAAQLGKAFGTSAEIWSNLDLAWRTWRAAQARKPLPAEGGDDGE